MHSTVIIDKVRNAARVIQAGAQMVPLLSDTSSFLPRLTTDPTAAWRAEGAPVVAPTRPFDRVTFAPKSVATKVLVSYELSDMIEGGGQLIEEALNHCHRPRRRSRVTPRLGGGEPANRHQEPSRRHDPEPRCEQRYERDLRRAWRNLLVGFRPQVGISVDRQGGDFDVVSLARNEKPFMDNLQLAIYAWARARAARDPEAFNVVTGVRP
jgi:hypothetical protein